MGPACQTSYPTAFSKWGLGYFSHTWNGSLYPWILESCVLIFICLKVFFDFLLDFFFNPLVFSGILFSLLVFVFSLIFFFCIWLWSLYHCQKKKCLIWFHSSWTYWESFYSLMWSLLIMFHGHLNIYAAIFGQNVLYMSINLIWSNMMSKAIVSLFIFCLDGYIMC